MLAFAQPALEVGLLGRPENGLADGRDRDQRRLHLDEGGFRRLRDSAGAGALIRMPGESSIDLRHIKRQPAQRSVTLCLGPVGR
ncbi:hypothetical protein D9M72_577440 [compost metagenome]